MTTEFQHQNYTCAMTDTVFLLSLKLNFLFSMNSIKKWFTSHADGGLLMKTERK